MVGSLSEPADDADLPRHRIGDRVRRSAMDADQDPKYLNSPETPIYSKGRTLYGLNLTKAAIRKLGYAVLVEGYFDFAQVFQTQAAPVVASCGTALTLQQAQLLRRFTSKVVLSYDPDAAGQGAAARSCELLVAEGFDVNVAGDRSLARIRTRSFAKMDRSGTANGSRPPGRIWNTCSIGPPPESDFGQDDQRRQFLGQNADGGRADSGRGRPRPVCATGLPTRRELQKRSSGDEIRKAAVSRKTSGHGPGAARASGGSRTPKKP